VQADYGDSGMRMGWIAVVLMERLAVSAVA